MSRIVFHKGEQRKFLERVQEKSGRHFDALALECDISPRSMRAWRREDTTAHYESILSLSKRYRVPFKAKSVLEDYWSAKKEAKNGGKARCQLHGSPGTLEGRKKGGEVSQLRRKENPEYYKSLGCNVRKSFIRPPLSADLAELVGILLGDGSLTDNQLRVTLHRKDNRKYAIFVQKFIAEVLKEEPTWSERQNVIDLTLSGVGLIECMESLGLRRGSKVANQVGIPKWVDSREGYAIACMRGLFDTDGCIYTHKKPSGNYLGWTFTNHSIPIIRWMIKNMEKLNFLCKSHYKKSIFMYNRKEIARYMEVVGSSNPKHKGKFEKYMEGCAEW